MSIIRIQLETLLPHKKPLPAAIYKRVTRTYGELIFMGQRLKDGTLIPILNEAYNEFNNRTGSHIIPFFDKYAEGVIEGRKFDFKPFIDTPQNVKELILNEVLQDIYLFPTVEPENKEEQNIYLNECMYHYGIQIGKLYKAWSIVVMNPAFFLPDFEELDQQILPSDNAPKEPKTFTRFEDLFYDSKYIEPSINILKNIEPSAIDDNNFFTGNLKGVITVWYDELERAKITKPVHKAALLVQLLNRKFHNLNIARSTIYSRSERSEEYRLDIKGQIRNMKQVNIIAP